MPKADFTVENFNEYKFEERCEEIGFVPVLCKPKIYPNSVLNNPDVELLEIFYEDDHYKLNGWDNVTHTRECKLHYYFSEIVSFCACSDDMKLISNMKIGRYAKDGWNPL